MAIQPAGVWGIDLGQCALKALRVENVEGQLTATAFDYVEHPKILSQPDADPDQLTREALEKFLSRNSLRGDLVCMSVPGQSGLARFVKLPPVEEKKIPDIVRFEAKQQIPFNLEEVVWDYQKLNSGAVSDGFAMETEIGLFAIKRDAVSRSLQHFRDVKVEVHVVQMAPLALCNFVAYDLLGQDQAEEDGEAAGRKRCIVALDIGADNSNLVITDGQRIIWQRPIPLGGNHFTRALTKDLKLTFAKAEHLKRNATKSPDLKKILSALKPVLNDFVGEVQRSLGYFTNTHRDAHILYMIGLGNAFRLPGIQKFLSEKLQLDVRKLQKLERLSGDGVVDAPAYTENVLSFGVAYGLALQGLGIGRLTTNLLPPEIQVERLVRAKKPWVAAAAAALLLGTSVMTLGYTIQNRTYASAQVQEALKGAKEVKELADKFEKECTTAKDEITTASKDVKTIVAGQDERLNWLHLVKFINDALPRPDGSNLPEATRPRSTMSIKDYYFTRNEKAQDAYNKLQERLVAGAAPGDLKGDTAEGQADLVSVNIEAIMPLYTEDLSAYFSYLQQMPALKAAMETMRKEDRDTPPTEKGWVVEVRGYTNHKESRQFVVETLVENLARLKYKKPDAPAEGSAEGAAPATSAAPATPATSPSGGTSTPAAGDTAAAATDPEAQRKRREEIADPMLGKVSHVLLLMHKLGDPDPYPFQLIGGSMVGSLVGGGGMGGMGGAAGAGPGEGGPGGMMPGGGRGDADAPGGAGGMGMMGGMGSARSSWQPLSGGGSFGGEMMGGMGGMGPGGPMGGIGGRMGPGSPDSPGAGGMMSRMGGPMGGGMAGRKGSSPMMGGPGGMPGGPGGVMAGGPGMMAGGPGMMGGGLMPGSEGMPSPLDANRPRKDQLRRTEFIILFIWKEPTPSDELMTQQEATGADAMGGGMMPGGPGGAGPMGGMPGGGRGMLRGGS